jgi:hypothetical protein
MMISENKRNIRIKNSLFFPHRKRTSFVATRTTVLSTLLHDPSGSISAARMIKTVAHDSIEPLLTTLLVNKRKSTYAWMA